MEEKNNGKGTPKLRFNGFSDAWEQRKLGDIVEFFSGLTYSPENIVNDDGYFVLRSSNVKDGKIINADNVYVNSEVVNSKKVEVGDIIVVVRNGSRDLIGKHAKIKKRMENTVIGAFMTGIHSKESDFINALLDTKQFRVEINKNLGATINQITTGSFKLMVFFVPERIEEQTKIGTFFKKLDDLITLHQRKLEALQLLKKGFLQQMFPLDGESAPRIRFTDFDGDWEQRKLGELLNEVKRPIRIEDNKEYQLVTVKRRNGGITSRGKFKGKDILVKNYFELKKDDYLISKRQVVHGANGIVAENMDGAVVSNEYLVSVGNKSITTDYLTIISQLPQMYKMFFLSSYGIDIEKLVFNVNDWKKRSVHTPSKDEQVKISSFFQTLDNTITLHQRKLGVLQLMKKGFLQQMFPLDRKSALES